MIHFPNLIFNNIVGIVLCGGLSTRMGRDKGLIFKNQHTWCQIAFNNLASLQIPVYVSVNELQITAYKKIFSINNLIVDDNELNGPLKGLMAAYKKFPDKDLFVLATDMIDMDIQLLQELFLSYQKNIGYDYYVYKNEDELEPLCGIYKSEALKRIWEKHKTNDLPKHSMKYVLFSGTICTILLPPEKITCFANYNTL